MWRATDNRVGDGGAVFSAVRWTNIYDPFPAFFLHGDLIAGPMAGDDRFGNGILDLPIEIFRKEKVVTSRTDREKYFLHTKRFGSRLFTHNDYWTNYSGTWSYPSRHIMALRAAVGISRPVDVHEAGRVDPDCPK